MDDLFSRCNERRTWITAKHRLYPALSPANTIWFADTGEWSDPGGGYNRERYTIKISSIAEGNGS